MAGVSSQGTTFTFVASTFVVTSIQVNYGSERQRVAGAHMGLGPDAFEPTYVLHRTADEQPTIDIEFIGASGPALNASGALSVAGALAFSSTAATCISSQVGAAVGELVRGSASFRVEV